MINYFCVIYKLNKQIIVDYFSVHTVYIFWKDFVYYLPSKWFIILQKHQLQSALKGLKIV